MIEHFVSEEIVLWYVYIYIYIYIQINKLNTKRYTPMINSQIKFVWGLMKCLSLKLALNEVEVGEI